MSRLTDHRVPRPRLTSRLRGAGVSIIWAGAGCGKSTLARELRDECGIATIYARLDAGDYQAEHLAARLRRALRRAGRFDALTTMTGDGEAPAAALEALADWLASEPQQVHLVLDDVHNADQESCRLLARLADDLSPQHRLTMLVRGPAPDLAPLSRLKAAIWLDAADLAFTDDEVAVLAHGRFGIALDAGEAGALRQVTGGWVDAVVLALGRLAEADDRARELRELTEQPSILAHMISELFESLDELARDGVVQMAHLPLLSVELARLASGGRIPDLLGRATGAGVPMARVKDGWWEVAPGAREFLAGLKPLDPGVAEAAAEAYLPAGELRASLNVLLRAELAERAAALIDGLAPDRLESLDYSELGALIDVLPDEAIANHPRVLLHFARACEPPAQVRARAESLARAQALVAGQAGPIQREVDVEVGRDLAADGRHTEAEALVSAALAGCSEKEIATQARALDVLGRVAAAAGGEERLRRAESQLEKALVLCRALGQTGWAGQVMMALVERVYFARGQYDQALRGIDELLLGLSGRSRHRAVVLSLRGGILIDCGRFDEAESTLDEAGRLIEVTGDRRAAGYVAWDAARLASQRDDATATLAALHAAEVNRAEWFEHSGGAEFLADAADLLDRVGEVETARGYLARAQGRTDEAEIGLRIAEGAILARSGDPAEARAALADLAQMPRLPRREAWRLTLLAGYAALRGGDPDAPTLAARAFDEAAALGVPGLPLSRERRLAERLLPLAVSAGSISAARLEAERPPLEITLFGHFTITRGGHEFALPVGKPQELVQLVATVGGTVAAEEAIEELWPEATPESGRKGMRNALNRLRKTAGELLVRDGEAVRLPGATRIDLLTFEREASEALTGEPDIASTRKALASHGGEVLIGAGRLPWADAARERAQELHLGLLDLLAEQVEAEGDLGGALELIERAIETDPLAESRYLIAARILAAQGRQGSASNTLARGTEVIRDAGLPIPPAFAKLAEAIGLGSEHLGTP